jgi:uncharacterized membrane protein (UPF0127 family)
MRVLHEPGPDAVCEGGVEQRANRGGSADDTGGPGPGRVLAAEAERPESALANARGLRFRRELPEDYAFVMDVGHTSSLPLVGGPRWAVVDMLFVHLPLDVLWLVEGEVVKTKRLRRWRGIGVGKADTIVELPAGAAEAVAVGDTVRVVEVGAAESSDGAGAGG